MSDWRKRKCEGLFVGLRPPRWHHPAQPLQLWRSTWPCGLLVCFLTKEPLGHCYVCTCACMWVRSAPLIHNSAFFFSFFHSCSCSPGIKLAGCASAVRLCSQTNMKKKLIGGGIKWRCSAFCRVFDVVSVR